MGNHLQRLVYDDIREDTGLHADPTAATADHAANALDGCVEKMKKGERTSKPVFTSNTTVYNTNAITVETVHPAYTSQRCSETGRGFTHEDNCRGDVFVCQKCGKERHADYNAARNIAHNFIQNRRTSGSGGTT